jgi:hypothetical protein
MLLGCPRPCCPKQNTLKAHQRERVPAPPPVDWSWGARTVLAVKGSLRRAKQRRALDYCAPFRPDSRRDGRLRREHFAARPKSKRPASLLRRKAGLKTKKTNPSNRGGLDRSLHIRNCVPSAGFKGSWCLSWATRSCINMFFVTEFEADGAGGGVWPGAITELEDVIPGVMEFSSNVSAVDLLGDQSINVGLGIAVRIKGRHQAGIDHASVGHLHHLVRLLLHEGAAS